MSLLSASMFTRIWGFRFKTVVHVGAHLGEEMDEYLSASWGTSATIWIEALPSLCEEIRHLTSHLPDHHVINAALDENSQEVDFFEATNDQASSLLKMSGHTALYPEIAVRATHRMRTQRFDALGIAEIHSPAIARLDIQGAELRALKGFGARLKEFTAIWAEYSKSELYEDSALLDDLDAFLADQGFRRVLLIPYHKTWGDGIWIKTDSLPRGTTARRAGGSTLVFMNRVRLKVAFETRKILNHRKSHPITG